MISPKFISLFFRNRVPGQLVIQITDRCNARCPQCGMRVTEPFQRSSLSVDDIKPMLESAARQGFQAVSFTGGEPLLRIGELTALIRQADALGIAFIRTGTNGFIFQDPEKPGFLSRVERVADALAATPLRNFWISIDSSIPEIHEKMRGLRGVISGIEKALPLFHRRGLYPTANLGINRNLGGDVTRRLSWANFPHEEAYLSEFYDRYRSAFAAYFRFVISLGFTIVNACYPMSLGKNETESGLSPVYAATATEDIVHYAGSEKRMLFKALGDTVRSFRSRIRIFSPLSSLHAMENRYATPSRAMYSCRGGIDFFFVDAQQGSTFPCGYRGKEDLGKFQTLDMSGRPDTPSCRACDWECFRDPSELSGPILNGMHHPLDELKKMTRTPQFYRHWAKDLLYYYACDLFNGRLPLHSHRLASF